MKTDFYTKAILTLIALFLGVLAFDTVYEAAIPEAQAKTGKWECKDWTDMFPIDFETGNYDTSDLSKFYPNQAGWTFMTVTTYWDPKAEIPQPLFCGRP
mgnify:CR=1 FL=1